MNDEQGRVAGRGILAVLTKQLCVMGLLLCLGREGGYSFGLTRAHFRFNPLTLWQGR